MLVSNFDFAQVLTSWIGLGTAKVFFLGQSDSSSGSDAQQSGTPTSPSPEVPLPEVPLPEVPLPNIEQLVSSGSKVGLNLPTIVLAFAVLCVLAGASLIARHLTKQSNPYINPALVQRFVQRLWAWWLMFAILISGMFLHRIGTIVLFGLVSFWAFREFITMAPTRRGDHRALFWSLVVFTPLQYVLIGLAQSGLTYRPDKTIDFYSIYSVMIPVYASLFIPARIAVAGDSKRFLERSAQIQSGLLICVYCLSFAPALLDLELCRSDGTVWDGSRTGLLFFFILISQLSDVLQWTWGRIRSKRVIAKEISSTRTWDGVLGGSLSTGIFGALLYWVTPFTPWESAFMAIVVSILGFAGGITMSAIKRDRGVHDYGTLVMGHAGVLDRIDSICFSAPVFYHLTRFFFSVQ
ncbi:MAG: phosphatidate cytidylyltransferase [Planctomycetes bacterium]|nr:phosphatidate cytidylyltransferase [Planctomycetota bacterium]